jgi:uncharacterized protein (TIGR02231 family)
MYFVMLAVLAAISVRSDVDSVVVYPDQAMVIRKASAAVSGSTQLSFPDLPGILDDNSVRIRVSGLKLGEVQVKPSYLAEPTPRVKLLADSLARLDRRAKVMANEKAMLAAKMEFLGSVKAAGPDQMSKEVSGGKVDPNNWNAAIDFLGTQMMAVSSRQLDLDEQEAELSRVRQALAQELSDVRARVVNRKTVTVDVVAAEPGSFDVTLSYRVPGAVSWEPYYELRARPDEEAVTLAYYVRMEQSTNEDWNGVAMMLSTARPSAGRAAPEPRPWYVDVAEAQSYKLIARQERNLNQLANMQAGVTQSRGTRMEDVQYLIDAAVPLEAGISLQYAMPGRITLRSGEDPKKFFLTDTKMAADFSYYAYPRVQTAPYLRASMQNGSDFVFLAGKANTYVGDEFTGTTTLANVAPGESASPSFGVDDRMKVHHQRTRLLTSRTGLFTKRTRTEFEFKTTIENYHTKPVTITLVEQVPTSANTDIKVGLTRLEPKGWVENRDNGTYTYTFEMKPQEKLAVNIAYAVDYPTATQIAGLFDAINPARSLELNRMYDEQQMKKK